MAQRNAQRGPAGGSDNAAQRIGVAFSSAGTRCAAWLYRPAGAVGARLPLVVMAHGMGAERTFRLPAFAERFAARGLAVLLFDYRNFGDSDGTPRNLVDHRRHLADWQAALDCARGLPGTDPARIALWGTSFSGGHVLVTAAANADVCCVVAQVPFVDGLARGRRFPLRHVLKLAAHAVADRLAAAVGRSPHQVPLVSGPGGFAVLIDPRGEAAFRPLLPEGSTWPNLVPARFLLDLPRYRPIRHANRIRCPVLLIGAEDDELIPVAAVARTAARIRRCTFVRLPFSHFEPYLGTSFEQTVAIEADFLERHLRAADAVW